MSELLRNYGQFAEEYRRMVDDPNVAPRLREAARLMLAKFAEAQATETRRAETTGSVEDEGAGPKDIAHD